MKVSPRWIVLGAAAVFGTGAGFGAHYYIADRVAALESGKARVETVKQVVANQDMPRGTRLNADTVSIRAIPKEWAYADALTPEQLSRFDNAALDVPAGAVVFVAVVSSSPQATVSATSAEVAARPNSSLNFPGVIVFCSLLVTITDR